MYCKALSVLSLLLLTVFMLMTSGSETQCTFYTQFNCGSTKSIVLDELSDDGNFSCIEWTNQAAASDDYDDNECLLFIKTKREENDTINSIINFVLRDSNIDGELNIGSGEDPKNLTSKLHTVTNSTGWGENGVLYGSKSIWMSWRTTNDGIIKAQFQDLIFKQFPVTLHKEDSGSFMFPNVSCDYTYRPNSAFIWMLSTDDHCNNTKCNKTSMNITLEEASVVQSGDALILGMGNKTQLFQGPKSLLLPGKITEPLNIHLTLGEVFVILLTGRSFTKSDIKFKVNWERNSTKPEDEAVRPTTEMPESWRESVSICNEGLTKEEFSQNITKFQEAVADVATKFVKNEKISLASYKIRTDDVEIIDTLSTNGSQLVQILLTIVKNHDRTKPAFDSELLQYMFSNYIYVNDLRNEGFEIVPCRTNPDYNDWFWASGIAFIFSIAVLLIVWYFKAKNSLPKDSDDVKNLLNKDNVKQRTVGNEYEQGYTRQGLQNQTKDRVNENSLTEINSEDNAVTHAKTTVGKHHSDVGARRNPVKSNHVRPTSDPIRLQEVKNDLRTSVESPKSILRRGMRLDVLKNASITEDAQENVQEHLYDTVGSQKVLIITEAENSEPDHHVNAVSIDDEIEDTRC